MKPNFDLEMEELESEARRLERDELRFLGALWSFCAVLVLVAFYAVS